MERIALSLVSHTNVGKTTLARTLLRRDVGEVLDQAHVTELAEAWPLIATADATLLLWDTPGFGDTLRLARRLRHQGNPLGWFLHQVWDRVTDRPLWCSQEALRNVSQDADVVLYLVNAAEGPAEAGYVALELDLLAFVGRPVLVLLNQAGDAERTAKACRAWSEALAGRPFVAGVHALDAFTRSWVQEGLLLERVGELLPAGKRAAMEGLVAAWNARGLETLARSVGVLAELLDESAADSEPIPAGGAAAARKGAMTALVQRVETRLKAALDGLLAAHGLEGRAASVIRERAEDFVVSGLPGLDGRRGAFWGGLLSGAAGGLGADLLAGGLSFGAGALLGAIAGALGGAGLIRGLQLVQGSETPRVRWEPAFLDALLRRALLLYLAVAQSGRGRGALDDDVIGAAEGPWQLAVDEGLRRHADAIQAAWRGAAAGGSPRVGSAGVTALVDRLLRDVLRARHPEAAALLAAPAR